MTYRILYHHRIRADDGQAAHVRELIGALRGLGHEVTECALVAKTAAAPARAARAWRGVRLPRLGVEAFEIAYGARAWRRLVAAARTARPHFVYERHALHCSAGLRAARSLGVPLLLEVNAPMCEEMERLGKLRFPGRARRTERAVLGGADRVIAVTEVLRQRLIAAGAPAERCVVIGNAADPARYGAPARAEGRRLRAVLGIGPQAAVIGFVGYMREWHRLDRAVAAIARPGLDRAHLVLLGDGPAAPAIAAAAARAGVAARVHLLGAVSPEQLAAHVSMFDAALIPGINAYASPLKLFDTLAAGIPTLAPHQPNLREVLVDGATGLLFEPDDGDSLAERIAFVLAEPERAAAIGRAGRQSLIEHDWTWTGNARRTVGLYEDLVASARPQPAAEAR